MRVHPAKTMVASARVGYLAAALATNGMSTGPVTMEMPPYVEEMQRFE